MVDQIERLCQDCQQPLVLQQQEDMSTQSSRMSNNSVDGLDEKLALKDSQHFHNVIDVQTTQVASGVPEERQIANEHLYVFSQVGEKTDSDLLVRDLVESNISEQGGLQVKYPVCFACFDKILEQLDEKIKEKEEERITYGQQLRQLEQDLQLKTQLLSRDQSTEEEKEREALEKEIAELDQDLASIEAQEQDQLRQIANFEGHRANIEQDERRFWSEFNQFEQQLYLQQDSKQQMHNKTAQIQKLLTRLQESTFIQEVFPINAVDEIATISGFRLGRTQRIEVPQEEINAALGQVVYLLCVQAHHLGYIFDKYYLHAQGAFSKISLANDRGTKFELYLPSSEDRYNRALTMLLETVNLFITQHVIRYQKYLDGKSVGLYSIDGDKISNSSIRYASDSLEQWTRACKQLLTQLQWITLIIKYKDEAEHKAALASNQGR